jgi:hypothetical protein
LLRRERSDVAVWLWSELRWVADVTKSQTRNIAISQLRVLNTYRLPADTRQIFTIKLSKKRLGRKLHTLLDTDVVGFRSNRPTKTTTVLTHHTASHRLHRRRNLQQSRSTVLELVEPSEDDGAQASNLVKWHARD